MGLIYLDANALIYAVEDETAFGERARDAMENVAPHRLAVSPLVMMECLVKPIKTGKLDVQRQYEDWFEKFVQLPMPEAVYVDAAHLRARFNLKTPDALHLACAQHHRCEALWTNDDRLKQASHGLAVNVFAGA